MKKNTFVSSLFVVFISLSVQTNTHKISVHLLTGHSCPLEKKGGVETREKNRPQKNFGEKKISKKALLDAQYDFDDFDARMTVNATMMAANAREQQPRLRKKRLLLFAVFCCVLLCSSLGYLCVFFLVVKIGER